MGKKFIIHVIFRQGWRANHYSVFNYQIDERKEQFKICGRNGYVIIESNRPIFIKKGLRHRLPDFELVYGKFRETFYLEKLVEAIWMHLQEEQRRM